MASRHPGDQRAEPARAADGEPRGGDVHRVVQAVAVDADQGSDGEADQQAVLEDGPTPREPGRQLDPERRDDQDEDVEPGADGGDRIDVAGQRGTEEAQHVGAERDGQAGRADAVVHQHDPAAEEPGVRVKGPPDPGVGRAGAALPGVEPLVADGDAEHRDEADHDGQEAGVADRRQQDGQRDRDALRRSGAGHGEDDDVADA